jgi:indole-3-glycerol phosphate synthase/phosphoribosylanthranilate isomerase
VAEPAGILGQIVARKREEVRSRFALAGDPRHRARPGTPGRLESALGAPGLRFILEVKKASPSRGLIRPGVRVADQVAAYGPAAAAVSVLTDSSYFGGSLDDLAEARGAFAGPILAKDFFVDPRQAAEARIAGADAILVMLSVLDDGEARAMLGEARRLGMDALVEAHDESEVRRAVALGAVLIGVNNRDLRTLEVDLAVTERLAPLVPADRLLVSESGIGDRRDAERIAAHADAALVGTALMRAADPALAARALAFGPVKICGLTEAGDIAAAAAAGASHAGLIMVAESPRAVDAAAAEALAGRARAAGMKPVGVFRHGRVVEVAATARRLGLAAIQLHGEEDARYVRALRTLVGDRPEIWCAAPVGREVPVVAAEADRTLFDTQVGGRSGGTGATFDWSRLAARPDLDGAFLAGGLNPGNVRAAARVGAFGLDVGSGVEARPGRKDPARIAALFDALRPRSRAETVGC